MPRRRSVTNSSRIHQASRRRQFTLAKERREREDDLTLRGNSMELIVGKDGRNYYESELSQEDQKYTGWHWCSDRKAFYRWDNFVSKDDA
jgi:hypothetical protein|tara:strand:- start:603 stop:872 length:270 start_codon:yes stop_codon:yes gene_type:complete